MSIRRPSMFIGSSTEGLEYAKAIQVNLDFSAEVIIWSQGVFGLGEGTLESLVNKLQKVDFAALVVTPDDLVVSRGQESAAPRDNVLLELGLCIGTLGSDRSFLVYDRSEKNLKLPSDLAGITHATFHPHQEGTFESSLGAATTQIENKIKKLGLRTKIGQVGLIDEYTQFQIIADLLGYIADNFIIQMYLSKKSVKRETGLGTRVGNHWVSIDFPNKYVGNSRFSVNELCEKLLEANILSQTLNGFINLTDYGNKFAEWLINNGYKADAFNSNIGGWGKSEWFDMPSTELLMKGTQSYD